MGTDGPASAPLTSGAVPLELQCGCRRCWAIATRRCSAGGGSLSPKVIPAAAAQSLRRPAPHPILAPGSPGPASPLPRGARSPSGGSAAALNALPGCPLGKDYIPWRKDTEHKTRSMNALRRPMGKWQGSGARPGSSGDLPPRPPGAGATTCCCQLGMLDQGSLTLGPGCPSCPGLTEQGPDLWILGSIPPAPF